MSTTEHSLACKSVYYVPDQNYVIATTKPPQSDDNMTRQVPLTVFRTPSAFGYRPRNVLRRHLNIAQLAMNTVLRRGQRLYMSETQTAHL